LSFSWIFPGFFIWKSPGKSWRIFQLVIQPNIPKISDGFSDVFLYNTSSKIQTELGKKYKIKIVDERAKIWRMEKKIVKK